MVNRKKRLITHHEYVQLTCTNTISQYKVVWEVMQNLRHPGITSHYQNHGICIFFKIVYHSIQYNVRWQVPFTVHRASYYKTTFPPTPLFTHSQPLKSTFFLFINTLINHSRKHRLSEMTDLSDSRNGDDGSFLKMPIIKFTKLFIGGDFVDSVSGSLPSLSLSLSLFCSFCWPSFHCQFYSVPAFSAIFSRLFSMYLPYQNKTRDKVLYICLSFKDIRPWQRSCVGLILVLMY